MNPSISPKRKRDINIHAIVNLRKKSTYSGREHLKIVARKTMNHQWIKSMAKRLLKVKAYKRNDSILN